MSEYILKWFWLYKNSKKSRCGSKTWFLNFSTPLNWTSMPLIHLKGSLLLDLNAPDPSERVPTIGPQCLQSIWKGPYYWTSMPLIQPFWWLEDAWGHWPPIMRDPSGGLRALASNYAGPFWWLEGIGLQYYNHKHLRLQSNSLIIVENVLSGDFSFSNFERMGCVEMAIWQFSSFRQLL